jgi:tripartite-type tricarboxylate transporter receptor subunit TctC
MTAHTATFLRQVCAGLALTLAGGASPAFAQKPTGLPDDYPNKPIRVIVGSAPGGGADALARLMAGKLSEIWNVQFFVDNIATGVGGILALQTTYKSSPDGYTIQNSSGSTFQNATFQHKLPFDVRKVFAPVAQITISPQYMTMYPKAPFTNLRELIAYAKANPGKVTYGSSGVGSGAHLLGEYLSDLAGIEMTHVPYRGAGQSMVDAMAGRILVVFTSQTAATPNVKRGALRPVGISSGTRMKLQPDVPTIAEQGLPGLHYVSWIGWVTRAGTPKPVIDALNAAVNKVIDDPMVNKVMLADGSNPVSLTPEEFGKNINDALDLVESIVKKTGIDLTK